MYASVRAELIYDKYGLSKGDDEIIRILFRPMTEGATYNLLMRNFNDTRSNKAPFGVFTHAAWLVGPVDRPEFAERMAGYVR